jgi:hypothetical protein
MENSKITNPITFEQIRKRSEKDASIQSDLRKENWTALELFVRKGKGTFKRLEEFHKLKELKLQELQILDELKRIDALDESESQNFGDSKKDLDLELKELQELQKLHKSELQLKLESEEFYKFKKLKLRELQILNELERIDALDESESQNFGNSKKDLELELKELHKLKLQLKLDSELQELERIDALQKSELEKLKDFQESERIDALQKSKLEKLKELQKSNLQKLEKLKELHKSELEAHEDFRDLKEPVIIQFASNARLSDRARLDHLESLLKSPNVCTKLKNTILESLIRYEKFNLLESLLNSPDVVPDWKSEISKALLKDQQWDALRVILSSESIAPKEKDTILEKIFLEKKVDDLKKKVDDLKKKVDDLIIILSSEYVLPEWKNKILVELFNRKQWHDLGIIISSEYVLPEWRAKALSNILDTGNLVEFITDVLFKDALLIKGISKEFFNNNKNNLQEITYVISHKMMPSEFKQQLVDLLIDEKFIKENYQAIYSFTCKRDYYDLDQSLRKKISEALDDYPDHSGGVLETEDYSGDSEVGVQINDCDIESSSALDDYSDYMGGLEVGVQMDDCDIESSSSAAVVPSSSAHDSAVDGVYKAKLTTTATAAPNVYASSSAAVESAPALATSAQSSTAAPTTGSSSSAAAEAAPSPGSAVAPAPKAAPNQPAADAITTHNKELAGEELVKFFINFYHVLDSAKHLYEEEYRYAHYSISNIAIPFMFNKGIQHVTNFNPYIGTAIYAISLMPKYQKQDLLCPIIGNLSEEWCSDWNTQEKTFAIRAFDTSAALVLSAAISFGMHVAGQVLARIPHIDEYGQTLEKANLAIGFVASVLSIATEASYYLYQEVETQTNDNVPLLVGDTSSHDEI